MKQSHTISTVFGDQVTTNSTNVQNVFMSTGISWTIKRHDSLFFIHRLVTVFSWSKVSQVLGRSGRIWRRSRIKRKKQSPNPSASFRRHFNCADSFLQHSYQAQHPMFQMSFRGLYAFAIRIPTRMGWDWNSESYSENGFGFLLSDISKSIRFYLLNIFWLWDSKPNYSYGAGYNVFP